MKLLPTLKLVVSNVTTNLYTLMLGGHINLYSLAVYIPPNGILFALLTLGFYRK